MLILVVMAAGILIGYRWLPEKLYRLNTLLQLCCTLVLVFCMGALLGRREHLWEELGTLGLDSLLLALIPMALSAAIVFFLTGRRKGRKKPPEKGGRQ